MSKVHKYLYVSGSVFSGTDPMIWIRAKIPQIRNTGEKGAVIITRCFSAVSSTKKCHPVSKHLSVPIPHLYCKLFCFYMPVICIWCVYLINTVYGRQISIAVFSGTQYIHIVLYAFREILRKKAQRNFAEFREIKITFVVISYFPK
jgi:uncharacterized membrane protein YvlD (DUF360 family)